jgi:hypothetical protein
MFIKVVSVGLATLIWGATYYGEVNAEYSGSNLRHNNQIPSDNQSRRSLSSSTFMGPGKRVSSLNRNDAICAAGVNMDLSMPMEETVIDYYYAIESTNNVTTTNVQGRNLVRQLEDALFFAISPAVLWCYFDEDVNIGKRNLITSPDEAGAHRRMTIEEARRLSIVSFTTSPEDDETTSKYKKSRKQYMIYLDF